MQTISVGAFAKLLTAYAKDNPDSNLIVADRHLAIDGPSNTNRRWYSPLLALHTPCTSESLASRLEEGVDKAAQFGKRYSAKPDPKAVKAEEDRKADAREADKAAKAR